MRRVTKVYRTGAGEFAALRDISASFWPGEFIGVVGPSGAGKSTLVNMLSGVDHLTSGQIRVAGTPLHRLDENALALWRGRTVGVVYQSFELLGALSLLDNVMLPMDFCGLYHPVQSPKRALQLLEDVGLGEHALKRPTRISGGQQQRVAIARALANDPCLIVADEPTGNLDSATADDILNLFARLVTEGRTIVMVTHDETQVSRFSRVLFLVDGEIVGEERNPNRAGSAPDAG